MTATEYLTKRGWIVAGKWAFAPENFAASVRDDDSDAAMPVDCALIIQRARDAAEERAAWVRFAAAASGMVGTNGDGVSDALYSHAGAAKTADAMLAEYRARFAVEVES